VCWGREARREILRSMARRPTQIAPSRRYELLGSLLAPQRRPASHPASRPAATSTATSTATAVPGRPGPPLMFAVPVRAAPRCSPRCVAPCLPPCLPLGTKGGVNARKRQRKNTR